MQRCGVPEPTDPPPAWHALPLNKLDRGFRALSRWNIRWSIRWGIRWNIRSEPIRVSRLSNKQDHGLHGLPVVPDRCTQCRTGKLSG